MGYCKNEGTLNNNINRESEDGQIFFTAEDITSDELNMQDSDITNEDYVKNDTLSQSQYNKCDCNDLTEDNNTDSEKKKRNSFPLDDDFCIKLYEESKNMDQAQMADKYNVTKRIIKDRICRGEKAKKELEKNWKIWRNRMSNDDISAYKELSEMKKSGMSYKDIRKRIGYSDASISKKLRMSEMIENKENHKYYFDINNMYYDSNKDIKSMHKKYGYYYSINGEDFKLTSNFVLDICKLVSILSKSSEVSEDGSGESYEAFEDSFGESYEAFEDSSGESPEESEDILNKSSEEINDVFGKSSEDDDVYVIDNDLSVNNEPSENDPVENECLHSSDERIRLNIIDYASKCTDFDVVAKRNIPSNEEDHLKILSYFKKKKVQIYSLQKNDKDMVCYIREDCYEDFKKDTNISDLICTSNGGINWIGKFIVIIL